MAQGRVYLADSEVVKPKAKESVHCFDETTGETLWIDVYDVAYEDPRKFPDMQTHVSLWTINRPGK